VYRVELESRRQELQGLISKIKQYNQLATEWEFDADNLEEELGLPVYADSVEAAEVIVSAFVESTKPKLQILMDKFDEVEGVAQLLHDSTEEEAQSAFSRYSMETLMARRDNAQELVTSRETQLEEFLQGEKEKEELRSQFAEAATAFDEYCDEQTEAMKAIGARGGGAGGDVKAMEAQQEEFQEAKRGLEVEGKAKLEALVPVADQLEELGVVNNPHTPLTINSVLARYEALNDFVQKAISEIEEQILAAQSQGLTAEQVKEIKEVFDHFDKDGTGQLDAKEFHLCVNGIGLMLSEQEALDYIKELDVSGDGLIDFSEFSLFMVQQLSAGGNSKADVIGAFEGLCISALPPPQAGEADVSAPIAIRESTLERNFVQAADRAYLMEHMKAPAAPVQSEEGEYEYTPFVVELFSR
jgi:hypothetical protein